MSPSAKQSSGTIQSLTPSEVGTVPDEASTCWSPESHYKHLLTVQGRILKSEETGGCQDLDKRFGGTGDRRGERGGLDSSRRRGATVVVGGWLGGGSRKQEAGGITTAAEASGG